MPGRDRRGCFALSPRPRAETGSGWSARGEMLGHTGATRDRVSGPVKSWQRGCLPRPRAARAGMSYQLSVEESGRRARARRDEAAIEPDSVMPTGTKKVRSSRTQPKKQTEGPSPAKGGRASPRGSGAGGTFGSPALAAPAPGSPAKASAARRRRTHAKKLTDLLPTGCPADTPTRSEGADNPGAKGRSVMRSVALDLGAKKIAYCEVSDGF